MVLPIPAAFGAVSFATNALGAFGQQQQADAEYRYSEKQRRMQDRFAMNDYNRRVQRSQNDWKQALAIRAAQVKQYKGQIAENNRSANEAMYRNNRQMAEIQDRQKSKALDQYLQVLETNAMGTAQGGTGRRAQMGQRSNLAALGRQMSLQGDALVRHQEETQLANQEVQNQRRVADMNAYYPVSIPMQRPMAPAPPMRSIPGVRPNRMGLYSNLLSAGIGAAQLTGQLNPGGFLGFGRDQIVREPSG